MNLRPKIAAEVVDALLADLDAHGWSFTDLEVARARWVELALSKFVSHSFEFPPGLDRWISSNHPEAVESYLSKYPALRPVVDDCKRKALEIDPTTTFELEVWSDPEGCHVCYEGQSLRLVMRMAGGIPQIVDKGDAFRDWWIEYPGAFGPDSDPVFDLLSPRVEWRGEES